MGSDPTARQQCAMYRLGGRTGLHAQQARLARAHPTRPPPSALRPRAPALRPPPGSHPRACSTASFTTPSGFSSSKCSAACLASTWGRRGRGGGGATCRGAAQQGHQRRHQPVPCILKAPPPTHTHTHTRPHTPSHAPRPPKIPPFPSPLPQHTHNTRGRARPPLRAPA